MFAYNISARNYVPVPVNDDIASAGFISSFVNDGDQIFYIAGKAHVLRSSFSSVIPSFEWDLVNYPSSAHDNNGESGVAYNNNKIYFLGGRVPSQRFKSFNVTNEQWLNEPDFLHNTKQSVMAVAGDKIYSLGGGSSHRDFSVYSPGGSWKALPGVDWDVTTSATDHLAAVYKNRFIVYLQEKSIYIYDTKTDKWKDEAVLLALVGGNLNIFSDENTGKIYVIGKNPSNDMMIHEVILTDVPED